MYAFGFFESRWKGVEFPNPISKLVYQNLTMAKHVFYFKLLKDEEGKCNAYWSKKKRQVKSSKIEPKEEH